MGFSVPVSLAVWRTVSRWGASDVIAVSWGPVPREAGFLREERTATICVRLQFCVTDTLSIDC